MVKRNIPLIAKIPGMEGIAEYLQNEIKEQQTQSLKPKQRVREENETQVETKPALENSGIAELLTKEFDKEKIKTVSEILVMLAQISSISNFKNLWESSQGWLRRSTKRNAKICFWKLKRSKKNDSSSTVQKL